MTLLRSLFTDSTSSSLLSARSTMETSIFTTMASDTSTFIPAMPMNSGDMPMWNLIGLVSEAIFEVVCVSLPGFILAKCGMFSPSQQKFIQKLNMNLFTPCLIFTKLGNKLEVKKLAELAIIPAIWVIQMFVSWLCALVVSKCFRFGNRARNFVIAMAVFGNSSSLPMSLIISLSMTISGLHWDKVPNDNDEQVAARGILYLLIFQQLGQAIRWTWGSTILLKKREIGDEYDDGFMPVRTAKVVTNEEDRARDEEGRADERASLLGDQERNNYGTRNNASDDSGSETAGGSGYSSTSTTRPPTRDGKSAIFSKPSNATIYGKVIEVQPQSSIWSRMWNNFMDFMSAPLWAMLVALIVAVTPFLKKLFFTPGTFVNNSVTRAISQSGNVAVPLILVVLGGNLADVEAEAGSKNPMIQTLESQLESLLKKQEDGEELSEAEKAKLRSLEEKISQMQAEIDEQEDHANHPRVKAHFNKLLIASLISRMVLPFLLMFPMLSLAAKYMQISVLDDPIFVVVCCLLAGSPTALQMTQICGDNEVYEKIMARIMLWSYVILILPVTMINVVGGIKIVDWAR